MVLQAAQPRPAYARQLCRQHACKQAATQGNSDHRSKSMCIVIYNALSASLIRQRSHNLHLQQVMRSRVVTIADPAPTSCLHHCSICTGTHADHSRGRHSHWRMRLLRSSGLLGASAPLQRSAPGRVSLQHCSHRPAAAAQARHARALAGGALVLVASNRDSEGAQVAEQ